MGKLLPLIIVIVGLAGGLGAGVFLKPAPMEEDGAHAECAEGEECDAGHGTAKKHAEEKRSSAEASEFASLNRQFVVPIVTQERVAALVVASLAIEVDQGQSDLVFDVEPKLRDAFLEVLFVHAHSGGFDGQFTSRLAMKDLRDRLSAVARDIVGEHFQDVLITEIVRQDL